MTYGPIILRISDPATLDGGAVILTALLSRLH